MIYDFIMENYIYSEEYDENLSKIYHYRNHPQMLPFVGCNWGKEIKKILLVGESSFTENSLNKSKNWYETTNNDLVNKQIIKDTSPREIIKEGYSKDSFGNYRIFTEINNIVKEISNNKKDILYLSFLNFFQRPAMTKNEDFDKFDISVGNKIVKEVVEILQPEYIFFLSNLAWNSFNIDYDSKILIKLFKEERINYSCHPTNPWWNRESKEYSGKAKEKFKCFLSVLIN
jgi:hypothetical protein